MLKYIYINSFLSNISLKFDEIGISSLRLCIQNVNDAIISVIKSCGHIAFRTPSQPDQNLCV